MQVVGGGSNAVAFLPCLRQLLVLVMGRFVVSTDCMGVISSNDRGMKTLFVNTEEFNSID